MLGSSGFRSSGLRFQIRRRVPDEARQGGESGGSAAQEVEEQEREGGRRGDSDDRRIEVERDVFVKFDVFVNDEEEAKSGPKKSEFAGSFVNVPHKHKHHTKIKTRLRLGTT
ncbi:catechol oxidase [Sarracenia purpurea var. burkii]